MPRLPVALALTALLAAMPALAQKREALTEEDSKRHVLSFVSTVATMAGAVAACDRDEAVVVQKCATLILNGWPTFTGMPAISDPGFPGVLASAWVNHSSAASARQMNDPPKACGEVLAEARRSRIWDICERPGAPRASSPPAPASPPSRPRGIADGPIEVQ